MNSTEVSKTCVDICFTKRDKLIKMCMQNALDSMRYGSNEEVPKDSSIISYIPSKERFVDYVSEITKIDLPAKEIAKLMIVPILDKFRRSSKNKRRITFDSDEEEEEAENNSSRAKRSRRSPSPSEESQSTARSRRRARRDARRPVYVPPREPEPESVQETDSSPELSEGDISDIVETPVCPSRVVTLPMPLAQTNSGSMTSVSREYFPSAEFVFPGIYTLPNDSGYILFCVDNSRYSNSWNHSGDVTTFTWVTASKDRSRVALTAISESKNVFVFRKISGEVMFRYIGKVFRSENIDKRAGTVDMSVC